MQPRWKKISESIDGEVLICWVALVAFAVIALLVLA
jgi:hypothetical protein